MKREGNQVVEQKTITAEGKFFIWKDDCSENDCSVKDEICFVLSESHFTFLLFVCSNIIVILYENIVRNLHSNKFLHVPRNRCALHVHRFSQIKLINS